jgi:flagellar biosynthesis/type III secretory pathway chaperone
MQLSSHSSDSISAKVAVAKAQAVRLHRLLEEEFEALKSQDLQSFESLQQAKSSLLNELSQTIDWQRDSIAAGAKPGILAAWESFRLLMLDCRDLHRRNELLILRKRDAVRGALQALVGGLESTASVDVYDRLGRQSRPGKRQKPYAQA